MTVFDHLSEKSGSAQGNIREIPQAVLERRGRTAQVVHLRLNAVERVVPFFKRERCGISLLSSYTH